MVIDPEERAARGLLDTWLKAQNEGDFTTYSALYAETFAGLKRVGEASFRFTRRGWLADRRPMFAGGARVAVSAVDASKVGERWFVSFEQAFSSSSYRDTGRKLLVLSSSGGALRIVREEMGAVRVDGGGGSARGLPGFFAVVERGLVLRTQVEDAWLTPERLKLSLAVRTPPSDEDPAGVDLPDEGPLRMQEVRLPPEVRAMQGKRVFVTVAPARAGLPLPPPCESRIVEVTLASSATPAFESVRGARRLDHVYGTYVLGRLDPPCPRGLWASETPPEAQFLPEPPSPAVLVAARSAFRGSPEYAALQAEQRKSGERGAWHERAPAVVSFGARDQKRLVHVSAYRYGNGERDGASLSLLFEQSVGVAQLRRIGVVDRDGFMLAPRLAFDLEGDGRLELLTSPSGEDSAIDVVQEKGAGQGVKKTTVFFSPDFVCSG